MNVLTIDIGNTLIKIDIWKNFEHLHHIAFLDLGIEEMDSLIDTYHIQGASVCSVRNGEIILYECLFKVLEGNASSFTAKTCSHSGTFSLYRGNIGSDRAAACLGALSLFEGISLLVIDAGTAITLDVVDSSGKFRGGNISLGISGRLQALHENTSQLPLVRKEGEASPFGLSTETAIRDGAINGVVGEVLFTASEAKRMYGVEKVVLTGGDGEFLLPFLRKNNIDCHFDPWLVGRGLNYDFISSQ